MERFVSSYYYVNVVLEIEFRYEEKNVDAKNYKNEELHDNIDRRYRINEKVWSLYSIATIKRTKWDRSTSFWLAKFRRNIKIDRLLPVKSCKSTIVDLGHTGITLHFRYRLFSYRPNINSLIPGGTIIATEPRPRHRFYHRHSKQIRICR